VGITHAVNEPSTGCGAADPGPGPIAYRLMVGVRLRRLREGLGIGQAAAAEAIGATHAKISRLELGRGRIKRHDVADLLTLYGVTDEAERETMFALVDQADRPGWWHDYADLVPPWLEPYIGLEQAARLIRAWQVRFVPGLLQTEGYARAVIRPARHPSCRSEEDAERRVALRMERQRILTRSDPPKLWVILDEAVLRRQVGGAATMRDQLRHLIDITELGNVTIQILPLGTACYLPPGGPVVILRLAGDDVPDVVYLERLGNGVYPERPAEVMRYRDVFNRLSVAAEPPPATITILNDILQET
jgi:Predicted transcriptional regulators